jgi:hypothetical protein
VEQRVIVVTMMGGLGNQMFQYATGRAVSHRTDRRLVLDTTMMPSGEPPYVREFLLHGLPIDRATLIVGRTVGALAGSGSRIQPLAADVRAVLRSAFRRWTLAEPSGQTLTLDPGSVPARLAVLYGYWQSPTNFSEIAPLIRRELLPPIAKDGAVAQLLRRLDQHDTIAVHVRRGDYVAVDHIARTFGTLGADHFVEMGTRVAETCDRPAMVVLCEDTAWAKTNIRFDAPTFYAEESAPLSAIEGMALLSRTRHHVLSNSSFSWWGAWLADHPDQKVIAPGQWFTDPPTDWTFT